MILAPAIVAKFVLYHLLTLFSCRLEAHHNEAIGWTWYTIEGDYADQCRPVFRAVRLALGASIKVYSEDRGVRWEVTLKDPTPFDAGSRAA